MYSFATKKRNSNTSETHKWKYFYIISSKNTYRIAIQQQQQQQLESDSATARYLEDAAASDELVVVDVDDENLVDVIGRRRVEQLRSAGATPRLIERLRTLRVVEHRSDDDRRLPGTQVVGVETVEVIRGAGEQRLRRPVDGQVL